MYQNLPPLTEEKLLSKNFGSIGHLTGSKMIDDNDKLLSIEQQEKYTVCKRDKNDIVIITEKIDGMNAGVIKKNGFLYPINRKGYDTRNMGKTQEYLSLLGNEWAKWVDNHYQIYDSILEEGERLVFENAILKHTLEYRFRCEPVFLLAKYRSNNTRINYKDLCELAKKYSLNQPPLLNIGVAIPPEIIISQYPKGIIGVKGQIEGVVYSYEHNGEHESCAKYVSNRLMGTINPKPQFYNKIV
ncbi:MAG: hypothetical protein H2184_15680 [Candidatus Galacturonibacter soehngenii]|nr:hypothetical protein [Candidatus Galacturonibacter soehngenii]